MRETWKPGKKSCCNSCRPHSGETNRFIKINLFSFLIRESHVYHAVCLNTLTDNISMHHLFMNCKFGNLSLQQLNVLEYIQVLETIMSGTLNVQVISTWVDRASSCQLQQCCHWGGIQTPVCWLQCWPTPRQCYGPTSHGWKSLPWLPCLGDYLVKGQICICTECICVVF